MKLYFVLLNLLFVVLLSSCTSLPWSPDGRTPELTAGQDAISELIAARATCSPDEPATTLEKMGFSVQVGAFSQLDNAVSFEQTLQNLGVDAYYFLHESGLYKVRFGDHENYLLAQDDAERLQRQGVIESFFIVYPDQYAAAQVSYVGQDALRQDLVNTAQRFLGVPYSWGGEDPRNGFDCSGLTMVSYRLNGLNLPRNSRMQYKAGRSVGRQHLQKGDLVFFATQGGTRVTHVGMYVGDDRFVHAPRTGQTIRFSSLSSKYWRQAYVGGRSYL